MLSSRYAWTSAEVEELQRASLIVAADVIYSDDLTDAFFSILESLMMQRPEKVWNRKVEWESKEHMEKTA